MVVSEVCEAEKWMEVLFVRVGCYDDGFGCVRGLWLHGVQH